jgi:hypothetical protein
MCSWKTPAVSRTATSLWPRPLTCVGTWLREHRNGARLISVDCLHNILQSTQCKDYLGIDAADPFPCLPGSQEQIALHR